MVLASRHNKKGRLVLVVSVALFLMVTLVILVMTMVPSPTRKTTTQQEDPVFDVSGKKTDPQYSPRSEQSEFSARPDPIDNNLFSYGIDGGSPGACIVHATCSIDEIDYSNYIIVVAGFAKEIEEKIEADKLAVNCSDSVPTRMEMSFDELYVGEEIKFDFLWPQTSSPITGIICVA